MSNSLTLPVIRAFFPGLLICTFQEDPIKIKDFPIKTYGDKKIIKNTILAIKGI